MQPGGGGLGALRSKPTTSLKRPAKRRIMALPILPLEPVTITMLFSVSTTVPPSCTFDYLAPYPHACHEAQLFRVAAVLPHEVSSTEETLVIRDADIRGEFAPDFVAQAQARFNVVQASADPEPHTAVTLPRRCFSFTSLTGNADSAGSLPLIACSPLVSLTVIFFPMLIS